MAAGCQGQKFYHCFLEVFSVYDHIYHAMLQQKFSCLKIVGKLLFNCLLNDSRPAKPIRLFGFGNDNVPSIAKLADTPPKVGSVSMDINGSPVSLRRDTEPDVLPSA